MMLSETTFVIPGDPGQERTEGVRVRIFTTVEELPFAGHPTLGTASWLHLHHPTLRGAEKIVLNLQVGPIEVSFEPGGNEEGVRGSMRQKDAVFGEQHDAAEVARVLGVAIEDMLPGYAPQTVSTGNPFCVVALQSVDALRKLAIPQREATAWLRERQTRWFYVIAPAEEKDGFTTWRARMQWHSGEDPATGSAAGPCIAWLVREGLAPSGQPVVLEQGVDVGRPSRLVVEASRSPVGIASIWVGGRTIPVAEGRLFLP
jgi:trans-2,3-dihydro-3-hydroxyanthranilate isomerase